MRAGHRTGLDARGLWVFLLLAPLIADAADQEGKSAVKGAGIASCEAFVEARVEQSNSYYQFGGWLSGYLTAYNQNTPETFDIAPWQSTDLLAGLLDGHCKKYPEQPFIYAVNAMLNALKEGRLRERSELVEIQSGGQSLHLYQQTMREVQQVLARQGHYRGTIDGVYGPRTKVALQTFQKARELESTGLPDQKTLLLLLMFP